MPDPNFAQLPFKEQIAALRLRLGNLVPTAKWDDLSGAEHDRGFMVAGAIKAELIADIGQALDGAAADGTGLEAFRKQFRQIVADRGWHGWTGEGTTAGEAWRTKVIYRTNMATSYSAGRLAQLVDGKFPFWVYRHGNSREPRLQHLAWNGLVLAADDAFWEQHYPPNGWGCSCYVGGARSKAAATRLGGDPEKPFDPSWNTIDPKTDAPVGIGKGWGHAPGGTVTDTVLALRDKLDQLPPQPAIDLIQSWLKANPFADWMQDPKGTWPLLRLPDVDAAAIGAPKPVADLPAETVRKLKVESAGLTPADFAEAQRTVSTPTASAKGTGQTMTYILEEPGGDVFVVTAAQAPSGLTITDFRRLTLAQAQADPSVAALLQKGPGA